MSLSPYSLRCEHRSEPLGVDEPRPAFSWKLAATSAWPQPAGLPGHRPSRGRRGAGLGLRLGHRPGPLRSDLRRCPAGTRHPVHLGPRAHRRPGRAGPGRRELVRDRPADPGGLDGPLDPPGPARRAPDRPAPGRGPAGAHPHAGSPLPVPAGIRAAQPARLGPGLRDRPRGLPAPGQRGAGLPGRADARLDRLPLPAAVPGVRHHRPAAGRGQRHRGGRGRRLVVRLHRLRPAAGGPALRPVPGTAGGDPRHLRGRHHGGGDHRRELDRAAGRDRLRRLPGRRGPRPAPGHPGLGRARARRPGLDPGAGLGLRRIPAGRPAGRAGAGDDGGARPRRLADRGRLAGRLRPEPGRPGPATAPGRCPGRHPHPAPARRDTRRRRAVHREPAVGRSHRRGPSPPGRTGRAGSSRDSPRTASATPR